MMINNIDNTNFNGCIIKTSARTLPEKVQKTLPALKTAIGNKPYDVSLTYNKEEKVLDYIYTQADARVKQHKHSVNYSENIHPLTEMIKGWDVFEEKQLSIYKKCIKELKDFICKYILKV